MTLTLRTGERRITMSTMAFMNYSDGAYHMWGGAGLGMFFWVLLWLAVIVLAAVGLIKLLQGEGKSAKKSPIDIVKERYAKGEIDKKEYERLSKDLQE